MSVDSNSKDLDLHTAASLDSAEALRTLLDQGANPNYQDVDGATLLHVCALLGRADSVAILLERGANPLIVDDTGSTPFAALQNSISKDSLAALVKRAKDIFANERRSHVPDFEETLRLLRPHSAIAYRSHEGVLPSPVVEEIIALDKLVFNNNWGEKLRVRVTSEKTLLTLLAYDNNVLVGMKIGFERSSDTFYSWVGCVHPDYRARGIAGTLLKQQESWCKDRGYKYLTTESQNKFKNMLILNLKAGFDIIGTSVNSEGMTKIHFQKQL